MDGEMLEQAVKLSIVLGFIGSVITFVFLRPFNGMITDLHKAINELRADIKACEERRHLMEIKIAEIDQRARAAHHRIDRLEGRTHDELEHR
jgi:hypothetical protein